MASYPATWKEAIQRWYDEQKNFIYGKGPAHKGDVTGHYTQVVWAKTFLFGCAVAFCEHFYIYACHYCPEGNDVETMNEPYNAGEPCADCKEHCLQGLCTNPCKHQDQAAYCKSVKEQDLCWVPKFRKGCMATCDCKGKI
ncbi:cysteine-rich secretory protein 1-like isoform X2 [Lissotriton helveticus]